MTQSYVPTLCVVVIYLVMAITGPRTMASRKPFNVAMVQNILMGENIDKFLAIRQILSFKVFLQLLPSVQ